MRVVEIDSLQLNSSLDTKIGTNDWYLQLLSLSHGFFEYRVSERVWYVSKVVQQLLEFEPDAQQSKSLFNNESINELIDTFLLSPDIQLTQELIIRHKHQPWETLLLKCEKVIDSKGDVIVRGLLLDLSFKKKQDLIDSQLQKLQALGQLTSGVSHDFNNQLNGILGYVALMKTMTNDDTLLRYMDGIERSVRHST
ncbi:MAG: histidine kinase dimerization/phospho-acceptor domain-containing protein, partial [Turicibacter sp.]|nr:histidine kinase dimerization/phospho-acceptor domain-containing protein [Turicibacter sp.]